MTQEELLEEQKKTNRLLQALAGKNASITPEIDTKTFAGNMLAAAEKFNPLSSALSGASAAMNAAKTVYADLEGVIKPNLDTWRRLSNTGSSFGGSIVDMIGAAKAARVSVESFAELVSKNAGSFNGLTGQIGRGADAFAKFSNDFANSSTHSTETLKALGYSAEDINDVLALQLSNYQTINLQDEAATNRAILAATELATQMDAMAKLTGVSRKQQEEIMRKAQTDQQAEAQLRKLTANMEAKDAQAFRDNYEKQRLAAALRGEEQLFKEVFAQSTVTSKEAGRQLALTGAQGQATVNAALASTKGNIDAANAYTKEAQVQMIKNAHDVNYLTIQAMSPANANAKTLQEVSAASANTIRAESAVRQELKDKGLLAGKTDIEQARIIQEELSKRAPAPTEPTGGAASTQTLVDLESRAGDVANALTNQLIVPLNRDIGPNLAAINQKYLRGDVVVNGKTTTYGKATEDTVKEEYNRQTTPIVGKTGNDVLDAKSNAKGEQYLTESSLRAATDIGKTIGNAIIDAVKTVTPKAEGRAGGSPGIGDFLGGGSFNNMFENFGAGKLMELHGNEVVATKNQMEQIINKAQGAVGGLANNSKSTLDDIHATLEKLNTTMMQVARETANAVSTAEKQVRATKSLSDNRYA